MSFCDVLGGPPTLDVAALIKRFVNGVDVGDFSSLSTTAMLRGTFIAQDEQAKTTATLPPEKRANLMRDFVDKLVSGSLPDWVASQFVQGNWKQYPWGKRFPVEVEVSEFTRDALIAELDKIGLQHRHHRVKEELDCVFFREHVNGERQYGTHIPIVTTPGLLGFKDHFSDYREICKRATGRGMRLVPGLFAANTAISAIKHDIVDLFSEKKVLYMGEDLSLRDAPNVFGLERVGNRLELHVFYAGAPTYRLDDEFLFLAPKGGV